MYSFLLVDCVWSGWSTGICSTSCGEGSRKKTRSMLKGSQFGGKCNGEVIVNEDCSTDECLGKLHFGKCRFEYYSYNKSIPTILVSISNCMIIIQPMIKHLLQHLLQQQQLLLPRQRSQEILNRL